MVVRNVYNYKTTACMDLSLVHISILPELWVYVPIATAQYDTLSFPEETGDV